MLGLGLASVPEPISVRSRSRALLGPWAISPSSDSVLTSIKLRPAHPCVMRAEDVVNVIIVRCVKIGDTGVRARPLGAAPPFAALS